MIDLGQFGKFVLLQDRLLVEDPKGEGYYLVPRALEHKYRGALWNQKFILILEKEYKKVTKNFKPSRHIFGDNKIEYLAEELIVFYCDEMDKGELSNDEWEKIKREVIKRISEKIEIMESVLA
jgi:hypothetical protein